MDREAWRAVIHGVAKSWTRLSDWTELKGNQSWIFIGRTDASRTLATWCEELTHWKRPWCWERLKAGTESDDRGWDSWMTSLTQWTWVSDTILWSHPLPPTSPFAFNLSQHQGLFQWVGSLHEVAKILKHQLQHLKKFWIYTKISDDLITLQVGYFLIPIKK